MVFNLPRNRITPSLILAWATLSAVHPFTRTPHPPPLKASLVPFSELGVFMFCLPF